MRDIRQGNRTTQAQLARFGAACPLWNAYAESFVYADDMELTNAATYDPIGISCRICERAQCTSRADGET